MSLSSTTVSPASSPSPVSSAISSPSLQPITFGEPVPYTCINPTLLDEGGKLL